MSSAVTYITFLFPHLEHRIAVAPTYPGLHRFRQGQRFKQWTGDNSKALMKVSVPMINLQIKSFSFVIGLSQCNTWLHAI